MYKYLQRFTFIVKDRYLYKEFQKKLVAAKWIRNIKGILELQGQGNLFQNIFKTSEGEIRENNYKPKHKVFLKKASESYLKRIFYSYINSTAIKSFFSELKQLYKKENYFRGKEPSNKTSALTKSMNMDIRVVGTTKQLFLRVLRLKHNFQKNEVVTG